MPLHNKNYCTAVGFGTQKPMRSLCARHDILFRSVPCGIGVPAQRHNMACLQEKQAGTVQVVDGCGSVALYARTEGCDLLTIDNQHADVVVTRVVLPDSPRNLLDQLVRKPGKLARRQGANVFPTAKKARPHFGSRAKSVWEERRCYTSPRPSARESCRRLIYGERSPQIRNTTRSYAIAPHPRSSLRSFVRGRDLISRSYNVTLRAIQGLSTK
jgi:hypothetical protein